MVSRNPGTRATRLAVLTAAVLPVACRKRVIVFLTGGATVTFGGGGGTYVLLSPQPASRPGNNNTAIKRPIPIGTFFAMLALVSAEHQRLERKHQRLQPQDQGMYQRQCVDGVKRKGLQRACILRSEENTSELQSHRHL